MALHSHALPLLLAALLGTVGVGCGCGDHASLVPPADVKGDADHLPANAEAPPEDPPGTGRVAGRIGAGEGATDPARDPQTAPGCPAAPTDGSVRIQDGGLADVILWLHRGPTVGPPTPPPPAPAPAEVHATLSGCFLSPRALVARVGDTLVLHNADDRFHALQVRLLDGGQERPTQTIALAPLEPTVRWSLEQPGLYRLRSPQLPFLRGLLLVLRDDEYATTSTDDGSFALGALPAGSFNVQAVHEQLMAAQTTVEIEAGETAAVTATLLPAATPPP